MGLKVPADLRRALLAGATRYEKIKDPHCKQYDTIILDANAQGRNLMAPQGNQPNFSMLKIGESFVRSTLLSHTSATHFIICYDNVALNPPIRSSVLHESRYGPKLAAPPATMNPATHTFVENRVWSRFDPKSPATPEQIEQTTLSSSPTTLDKMMASEKGKLKIMRLHAESVKRALEAKLVNGALAPSTTVTMVPPTGPESWIITASTHTYSPRLTNYGEADMLIVAYARHEVEKGNPPERVHTLLPWC